MTEPRSHREAVERSLAEMRARYEGLPAPTGPEDAHSRALTMAITEVVMMRLADVNDAGGNREAFAQGFTHALGNVIASAASCFTQDDPEPMRQTARALCAATCARAISRVDDPTRGMVVVGGVDVGGLNGGSSC